MGRVGAAGDNAAMESFFSLLQTNTAEELPGAQAVTDSFHVVRLADDALDECRRRVQRDAFGRRGRKDDPHDKARRTLHTGGGRSPRSSGPD